MSKITHLRIYRLNELRADVTTLLGCLNEFPEFSDDALNSEIRSFETDLKVSVQTDANNGSDNIL